MPEVEEDTYLENIKKILKHLDNSLNPEIKQKWISALRSGKFVQGHGYLHVVNEIEKQEQYCCLGVLCKIENLKETFSKTLLDSKFYPGFFIFNDIDYSSYSTLPDDFRQLVNLDIKAESKLIKFNDDGYTFEQIANIIEEYL